MISEELQYRIHRGEREAFSELYSEHAKRVYLTAFSAIPDENCAKEAVKRVFSSVYRELRVASGPLDLDTRINQLTRDAIDDLRVKGLPDPAPAAASLPPVEKADGEEPAPGPSPLPPAPKWHAPPRPERRRKGRRGNAFLTLMIVLLILLILWMVCGILMDLGILPVMDLGYHWFNQTIYPLFSLAGGIQ